ncbi:MAG: hypothetical protein K0R94_369, partial [Burkholderiales bacterium]|nr:hypothetical protein [Burkholderiales bacterium]
MKIKSLIMLTIMAVISLNSWAMDSDEISIPKKNETNMCSFEYKDFAKYSAIFTEHFTFGLSSLIPDILEDTCSENDKMTEAGIQIDTLKGQIEEVKNELTHMGYNQGALWEKMGKIVNDMYLTPYTTALRDFDEYVTGYQSVFNGYGSLLEYSRKAVNDKNEVLGFKKLYVRNRTFASKFTETALLIQKLQGILPLEPNARKIAENLHSMCYDAKSIHGEVFETRKECNVIVRDMLLNITLRVAIAKKILADEINTINEAMRINNIDQKWIDSIGIGKFNYTEEQKNYYIDWINALQIANKITDKYSEDIKTILAGKDNEKLFPLLKDFPSELSDSMPNKFCYNSTKLKTGNYRFDPAILAWYPNGKENNN